MNQSTKFEQTWLSNQLSDPQAESMAKYKVQSVQYALMQTTLHRPKWQLFPTINLLPKKLDEVERCYKSLAKTKRHSGKEDEQQFQMIKQALKDKIAEKHRQALELRREESKVRWAIERQVKLKQKMEQDRLMREELQRNEAERSKTKQLREASKQQAQSSFGRMPAKTVRDSANPEANSEQVKPQKIKRPKRSMSEKIRVEMHVQQIEALKGQLREQCIDVLQREDNINSFLMGFRRKL